MVTLEQVEKLRKYANISYEEAKSALEEANGDVLEAIINLEKSGRINEPEGGGYYSSEEDQKKAEYEEKSQKTEKATSNNTSVGELIGKIFRWIGNLIKRGNKNTLEITRGSEHMISIPVTILVLLMVFMFWVTIPLAIIGLFFGFRYSFTGPDLGKESINKAMDSVADAAENLKKEVKDGN
ncbi:MAG: DUF4342 domain-containing protein [Gudongella sp.]|jgi:hypothetical protein|nr:DUF4342 domain-containing protein [Gudongella sp.]